MTDDKPSARLDIGKGPFTVQRWELDTEPHEIAVLDAAGSRFCYVTLPDCAGADLPAAKARATRIAEALNRSVFAVGENHLPTAEYEERAGVTIGHDFVYPKDGER